MAFFGLLPWQSTIGALRATGNAEGAMSNMTFHIRPARWALPLGFAGIATMLNMGVAWGMISATPFDYVGRWEVSAAPVFLPMRSICSATDMTRGLFLALRIHLARPPGGLAIASVGARAFLATLIALFRRTLT